MKWLVAQFVILIALIAQAAAQQSVRPCYYDANGECVFVSTGAPLPVSVSGSGGSATSVNISGVNGATPSATNPLWVAPASATAFPILAAPRSAVTTAGCTVGTGSAECVAASTANFWIQVQNTHAMNTVACSWNGAAALNSSNSFLLMAGQSASWGALTSGVPTNALNCIASGESTPLYVEYR